MHTPKSLHYTAVTLKTLCTLIILIFLTTFLQLVIVEMYREFYINPAAEEQAITMTDQEKKQKEIGNAQKRFAIDGTLYLVDYNVTVPGIPGQGNTVVKDSNNNILFTGKEKNNPYSFIQWQTKTKDGYYYQTNNRQSLDNLNLLDGDFTCMYAIPIVNAENKRTGHWFWDNQRYFKYYSVKGSFGGYIGANGYTTELQQVEPFDKYVSIDHWLNPKSYDPVLLYRGDSAVYQINFQNKQVETLYNNPNDPVRVVMMNNWEEVETSNNRPALTIITKSHKLFVFLKNPRQVIETQLPPDFHYFNTPNIASAGDKIWAQLTELTGAPKTDDIYVYRAWIMNNKNKSRDYKTRLFELDQSANFLEKNSFSWTVMKSPFQSNLSSRWETFGRITFSFSSPLQRLIVDRFEKNSYDNFHTLPMYIRNILTLFFETAKFSWSVNLSILAVLGVSTLLHGWSRQTSAIKFVLWIGFVLLFNLAGFLTYLAYNHMPMVQCKACGKRRNIEQDACCRCGATLPLPRSRETDLISKLSA